MAQALLAKYPSTLPRVKIQASSHAHVCTSPKRLQEHTLVIHAAFLQHSADFWTSSHLRSTVRPDKFLGIRKLCLLLLNVLILTCFLNFVCFPLKILLVP